MTRGVVTHDEGYILHSAEKILKGSLPYRDFDFVYTPASLFLTSLSFLLFKTSILSSRILMIIVALVSSYFLYKVIYSTTKNSLYATLCLLVFVAWGPTHVNFSWPVMYSILAGLAVCYFLNHFLQTGKALYLIFSGLLSFLVFLTKQNFGVAILIVALIFFLSSKNRSLKNIYLYSLGYIWGLNLFGMYLLATDSFQPFVQNMYFYTYQWIIVNQSLTTPFIFPDTNLRMILRTSIYLLPIILSLLSLLLLFIRKRFHFMFVPSLTAAFYIFSIRPTTDYVHLVPLLALSGIPLAFLIRFNISSYIRIILLTLFVALIITGFHTALFKGYYRWDTPLISQNSFLAHPRINVFVDKKTHSQFADLTKVIQNLTTTNDYIYVNSYSPMLYFITGRQDIFRMAHLGIEVNSKEYYDQIQGNLVAKNVKLIVTNYTDPATLPIGEYLIKNYVVEKVLQDFIIYRRIP